MFKVIDIDTRVIGVHTPDDVYNEVRRITGNMYCAAAARKWALNRQNRVYSILDFWDEQVSASKFGVVRIEDIPYFRVVAI